MFKPGVKSVFSGWSSFVAGPESWTTSPGVFRMVMRSTVVGLTRSKLRKLITVRSEEHTSELQSRSDLVCRLLLEKKKTTDRRPFMYSFDYETPQTCTHSSDAL